MTYSRKRKPGNDDEVLSLLSPSTPTLSAGPCSLAAAVASSPAKRLKAHLSSHESLASESSWPSAEPSETSNQEVVHVNNESNDKNRRLFYRTLESLDKTALSGLLSQLLQRHPSLEPEVFQWLPKPTLVTVSKLLSESEDRLNAAFPYSRNAPGRTSDYAFNRVRPLLEELKDQMVFYLDFFVSPGSYTPENDFEYPDNAMGYLALVSEIALHRLPEWQNPILNKATKEDIIEKTAQGWQMAVFILGQRVQAGKVFPPLAVKDWASSLLKFAGEIRGDYGMRETCESFMQSLGWLFDTTGLQIPDFFSHNSTINTAPSIAHSMSLGSSSSSHASIHSSSSTYPH